MPMDGEIVPLNPPPLSSTYTCGIILHDLIIVCESYVGGEKKFELLLFFMHCLLTKHVP